jgi:hypothetical protein
MVTVVAGYAVESDLVMPTSLQMPCKMYEEFSGCSNIWSKTHKRSLVFEKAKYRQKEQLGFCRS